jgi:hypothetical protein
VPTSAADTFSAWLEAFNDPDPAALDAFVAGRGDIARDAEAWARYRRQASPLTLLKVDEAGADGIDAVVQDRWDRCLQIKLRLASEPPHPITTLRAALMPPPPSRRAWAGRS